MVYNRKEMDLMTKEKISIEMDLSSPEMDLIWSFMTRKEMGKEKQSLRKKDSNNDTTYGDVY